MVADRAAPTHGAEPAGPGGTTGPVQPADPDYVARLAWPQIDGSRLLVVPLGSTEQHGPHLPLSTDTDVARALATGLAGQDPQVVLGPALPYGASGEHADFPGTLSIGQQALELLLIELCRSATQTWDRVLLLNGHGGNTAVVQRAVRLLRSEGRDVRSWAPTWRGDLHAGRTETSLQLALSPAAVQLELARPGPTTPLRELLPDLMAAGVRSVSPNGVLGDPAGASAQEGRALLAAAVAELHGWVAGWAAALPA